MHQKPTELSKSRQFNHNWLIVEDPLGIEQLGIRSFRNYNTLLLPQTDGTSQTQ